MAIFSQRDFEAHLVRLRRYGRYARLLFWAERITGCMLIVHTFLLILVALLHRTVLPQLVLGVVAIATAWYVSCRARDYALKEREYEAEQGKAYLDRQMH